MKELKDLKLKSLDELRKMNQSDLQKELKSSTKNLYVLKMKSKLGELKQTHLIKALRRYVAQLHTIEISK